MHASRYDIVRKQYRRKLAWTIGLVALLASGSIIIFTTTALGWFAAAHNYSPGYKVVEIVLYVVAALMCLALVPASIYLSRVIKRRRLDVDAAARSTYTNWSYIGGDEDGEEEEESEEM